MLPCMHLCRYGPECGEAHLRNNESVYLLRCMNSWCRWISRASWRRRWMCWPSSPPPSGALPP